MSNYSENNDFEDILERLLDNVDDSLDKRQGSIIYDALAPAAAELAQCYIALDIYNDQTYLLTAVGENLDNRVADYGLERKKATYSKRIITCVDKDNNLMDIEIGCRFSTPINNGGYNYEVTEQLEKGRYIATCETSGSVGNEYIGELLPLITINNLGVAEIIDTYIPAEDVESDEELRERALTSLRNLTFGGNIADYKNWVKNIDGIGLCKIIPVWNGGGTVKVYVIASDYTIPNENLISELQEYLDPLEHTGHGQGIAPIGHKVTVVAPTKLDINIGGKIYLKADYVLSSIQKNIEDSIKKYILEIQKEWENSDTLTIYISRIIAAILTVEGVSNVEDITINEQTSNLIISQTATLNQYPELGEVSINEN